MVATPNSQEPTAGWLSGPPAEPALEHRSWAAARRLQRDPNRAYEMRVFMAAAEVGSLFEELQHTLALLARARTFPELTALLKLYIIGWHSLSDLVATLLNEVYDLGIADQDVSFGAILRNHHVRETAIPDLVKRHSRAIRYDEFVKMRNDIVHRGKLDDTELLTIHSDLLLNLAKRSNVSMIDDEDAKQRALEAARTETRTTERVRELIATRRQQYAEHLSRTQAFLTELSEVLISQIRAHPV
ncbi:MAG TPA: Cthe_2314 family HEPN domain-containing protein [Thermoanaerobaculia bacterium]|nr:Cthe_2314 family HEPN domain-containing protein [Thermoanaerobaculia bacterium]